MSSIFTELNKTPYFLKTVEYCYSLLELFGGSKTTDILETLQSRLRNRDISVITDITSISATATTVSFTVDTNLGTFIIIVSRLGNTVRAVLMRNATVIETLLEIYLETPIENNIFIEPVTVDNIPPLAGDFDGDDPLGGKEHGSS